ncbi:NAD-P-binding protein [Schizopora paradoxa]|uniref:NAD-P-binding protein n=1 Tax=Schizopora paradoxa TaxID=27342 RepID=A0A0H2RTJ3_9AGAM|nr:NAD-P-binding protein [Schizopora paradoxa]
MTTWLVTGASRGLGFGLVKHILAASKDNTVFAACRNPSTANQLTELASSSEPDKLHIVKLDVADESTIAEAAKEVGSILSQKGLALDYLINNAGISTAHDTPMTATSKNLMDTLLTNTVGPFLVTQHFMPYLEKSAKPVLMNMSSGLGSITNADTSFQAGYRTSKAALNLFTKQLSVEKPEVIVFAMAPGWVKTDLAGPSAALTVDFSVSNMLKVLANVTKKDSGTFVNYSGAVLPW